MWQEMPCSGLGKPGRALPGYLRLVASTMRASFANLLGGRAKGQADQNHKTELCCFLFDTIQTFNCSLNPSAKSSCNASLPGKMVLPNMRGALAVADM